MINFNLIREKIKYDRLILIFFLMLKLVISFFPVEYGIFRDEFYYLAMSENLDFGFLDVPPLAPFLLAIVRLFLGVSYFSLHLLPALSGCLILFISYLIVKKLNGGLFAITLTLLCITFAPQYIATSTYYSYDHLDQLFWILVLYTIILLIKTDDKKYWIYFGIVAGFGLLSKITILYLGLGIFLAILLTKKRTHLLCWQFWVGGIIAFVIILPYIIWHISKDMIVLEYYKNYSSGKTSGITPIDFLMNHIVTLNPLTLPVWILGIYYFLFNKEGKKYNLLGIAFLIVSIFCIITKTKYYLLTPVFPVLFAGGAFFIESIILKYKKRYINWIAGYYLVNILISGIFILPLARPVMSVENFIKFSNLLKFGKQIKYENHELNILPQFFADRFGWEEMVIKIRDVYYSLTDEEKSKCIIIVDNYGEAGAIEYYGKEYNLPKPVSGHLQYYIWGTRGYKGDVGIILGANENELKVFYDDVKLVDRTDNKYSMPYENNNPIYICRNPKMTLEEALKIIKHFD